MLQLNEKLTKSFTLGEFLVSSTADAHDIKNVPTAKHMKNLREITAPGMQIVRDIVSVPVIITSAYRNPTINKMVGGVPNSHHALGLAVDCRAAGLSTYNFAAVLSDAMREGRALHGVVDQLIMETSRRIVHISFAPTLRGQVLTQRGGPGTPFEIGLVL